MSESHVDDFDKYEKDIGDVHLFFVVVINLLNLLKLTTSHTK